MTNKEGVAITEFPRDAMGNPTEEMTFDVAGKPHSAREAGHARFLLTTTVAI
jgi:hypothetical protein